MSLYSQRKIAFLVGISDYKTTDCNSWNNIHGVNDVDLISNTLNNKGFEILKLYNSNATALNIREGLSSLISSSQKGDFVYVHFSCHGQPVEDYNGDEQDGWDESIIPFDAKDEYKSGLYEGENHITDDELKNYFLEIRKAIGKHGLLCVVIDACHAGESSRGDDSLEDSTFVRGTKKGFSRSGKLYYPRIRRNGNFKIKSIKDYSDIVILEACRSYQSNVEIKENNRYYGPLSFYVNKVLSNKKFISDFDFINKVKEYMDADKRLMRQNMVYETSLKK